MTDPRPVDDVPERPPLPPQAQTQRPEHAAAPQPDPQGPAAPVDRQAPPVGYPSPSTPPPNPYGQAPARHAPAAPVTVSPPTGFAPPSSPGFGSSQGYAQPQQQYPQQHGQPVHGGQPVYGGQTQPAHGQGGYPVPAGYPGQPAAVQPAPDRPAKLGTTGLVLGGIGVLGGIIFGWTILLSIAAIALGFLARAQEPHAPGRALAAIITGFVGAFLSVGWLVYSVVTWLALTGA